VYGEITTMINMDKLNTPREVRGLEILSKGDTITTVKKNTWAVKTQTGTLTISAAYKVCDAGHGKLPFYFYLSG
jgi:hypothetical protein